MNYDLMLEFVKEKLEATDGIASKNPLHNFRNRYYHSKRVYEWCKRIHTDLECDLEVLYTAAIFHDVGRGSLKENHAHVGALIFKEYAKNHNAQMVIISAKIEEELVALGKDEAKEYLADLGVEDSGIDKMIKSVYSLLKLLTFITAGEKEVHAWTIKEGTKAPQAAGVIHTDFEKGFIRAQVISYEDYIKYKSETACKNAGVLRTEGKDYEMKDGDVVEFLFNV